MNIVVTGASRGIGYELVKLYSKVISNRIIAISRNRSNLERLVSECSASNVVALVCDLSDPLQLKDLQKNISAHFDTVDILVNNAGAIVNKPFLDLTDTDIKRVYEVNVFSVFETIRQLFPLMNQKSRSHIVNISSIGGVQGSVKFPGLSAYSSSKAALVCLTECLAEEFKEKNISINCLALGAVQTEMLEEAFPGYKAPMTASDMAEFIVQFSITGHNYMNGKVLPVSRTTP